MKPLVILAALYFLIVLCYSAKNGSATVYVEDASFFGMIPREVQEHIFKFIVYSSFFDTYLFFLRNIFLVSKTWQTSGLKVIELNFSSFQEAIVKNMELDAEKINDLMAEREKTKSAIRTRGGMFEHQNSYNKKIRELSSKMATFLLSQAPEIQASYDIGFAKRICQEYTITVVKIAKEHLSKRSCNLGDILYEQALLEDVMEHCLSTDASVESVAEVFAKSFEEVIVLQKLDTLKDFFCRVIDAVHCVSSKKTDPRMWEVFVSHCMQHERLKMSLINHPYQTIIANKILNIKT